MSADDRREWLASLRPGDHVMAGSGMRAELRARYVSPQVTPGAVVRWVRWESGAWVGAWHARVHWDTLRPLCDSGIQAPPGLSDETLDYCVASCGATVAYPKGRFESHGRPQLDRHNREMHPQLAAQIEDVRAASAD